MIYATPDSVVQKWQSGNIAMSITWTVKIFRSIHIGAEILYLHTGIGDNFSIFQNFFFLLKIVVLYIF